MRRILQVLLLVLFSGSLVGLTAQSVGDRKIAETMKRVADRSTDGLRTVENWDGSVDLDLEGRFQNVMLSRIDFKGALTVGCVSSLTEANSFFGRNLETGEALRSFLYSDIDTREIAQQHGMSPEEYKFYKRMVENSVLQAQLNPNTSTITIVNNDGAGEGFNDPAAATPEGGNNGTTLGQQRLNLFNFAAGIWGAFLDSGVNIEVRSQFDPLTCTPTSAVLGSAGTTTIHRDFTGAGLTGTWYHQPLANKQSGSDRSANPDINATFNSSINSDPGCLGGRRFYLGFDNTTPSGTTNLLIVLLHEMGHGLGFSTFVNGTTGVLNGGFPDVYSTHMFDQTTSKYWNDMSDAERAASAINDDNVYWDGPNVKLSSGGLTAGRDITNGRVQLFTPNPFQGGSSVSHFNTDAFPSLLMEPSITLNLPLDLDLTKQQMRDIGWYRDTNADMVPDTITSVQPTSGSFPVGSQATVTWSNTGGFNRSVDIELSTDGGTTFPTMLATNETNDGSFQFTIPNTPTSQARVRVRESGFLAPGGVSATNFTIGSVMPAGTAKFDFDGDSKTDIGIFRPAPGEWWYLRSSDGGNNAFQFGASTDTIVPADYTGDGKTDVAFFRPSSGEWFILRSEDGSFFSFPFGTTGDIPAPGDFDGDGKADPAIFRPSTATWYILNSGGGTTITSFGANGDKPLVADYDNDGKDDIAIFRPSVAQFWINRSTAGLTAFQFGSAGDKPLVADFTGDGTDDAGFFRPSTGEWFVLRSEDGSFFSFPFGTNGDIPVPGDYDGDGTADPAVFRPSNNTWFKQQSTSGFEAITFGVTGDVPVPSAFIAP